MRIAEIALLVLLLVVLVFACQSSDDEGGAARSGGDDDDYQPQPSGDDDDDDIGDDDDDDVTDDDDDTNNEGWESLSAWAGIWSGTMEIIDDVTKESGEADISMHVQYIYVTGTAGGVISTPNCPDYPECADGEPLAGGFDFTEDYKGNVRLTWTFFNETEAKTYAYEMVGIFRPRNMSGTFTSVDDDHVQQNHGTWQVYKENPGT